LLANRRFAELRCQNRSFEFLSRPRKESIYESASVDISDRGFPRSFSKETADPFKASLRGLKREDVVMWRSFFLAIGITTIVLGLECQVVEKAVLADDFSIVGTRVKDDLFADLPQTTIVKRIVTPPEWAPWSLMSVGAIIVLYAVTLRPSGGS
jgi:hypothetical protein